MRIIWVDSASFRRDRLPKLDTISFRVGDPAELSEVIAFALWIDRDAFLDQTIQHTIQVVHLQIDHRFLRLREVGIVLLEKGEAEYIRCHADVWPGVLERNRLTVDP